MAAEDVSGRRYTCRSIWEGEFVQALLQQKVD
jgi:hypothetical protein